MRSSWGETVALILRDCEPEARLEFMVRLGRWKRISQDRVARGSGDEKIAGDYFAAEDRLIKLTALEEHLEKELDMIAEMRKITRRLG